MARRNVLVADNPLAYSQAIISSQESTLPVTVSRYTDYWISIKPRHEG